MREEEEGRKERREGKEGARGTGAGHKHSSLPSDLMWDKELRGVTGGS